ncbi:hypothetical protein P5V15_009717 [Pogonomyrmex californicus]
MPLTGSDAKWWPFKCPDAPDRISSEQCRHLGIRLGQTFGRLGDSFFETNDPQDENAVMNLIQFLETRSQYRDLLQEDVHEKQNHFRNMLMEVEHENASLKCCNNEQKKKIRILESRICKLQNNIDGLLYKLNSACDAMRNMQQELKDKDRQIQQHILEKERLMQRCNIKIQAETDRMTQELETKLREQHERLTSYIKEKDDKLRIVKQILTSTREDTSDNVNLPVASSTRIEATEETILTTSKDKPSTSINPQVSKNSCWHQIHQTCSRAGTNSNDIPKKTTEQPGPSTMKDKSSSAMSIGSHISKISRDQIRQTSPLCAKTNSNDVQEKPVKEPDLTTIKEHSVTSDSKTKVSEKLNSTTSIDSLSSSAITSLNTTITIKTKSDTKIAKKDKIPVVNPRYRRSQNADRWIDHRPIGIVPTGTILQPQTQPHKRTIRKLTNPKDFAAKSSRYCLFSQEQDVDGELETKLYKADVLPTCGGGAQIVFNDIECLKQVSPTAAKCNGRTKVNNRPIDT